MGFKEYIHSFKTKSINLTGVKQRRLIKNILLRLNIKCWCEDKKQIREDEIQQGQNISVATFYSAQMYERRVITWRSVKRPGRRRPRSYTAKTTQY